jgi:alkylation response protein AidB-like acyl-CoA dehydrogenase
VQTYRAPLRDVLFSLMELHDYPAHYRSLGQGDNVTARDIESIVTEVGKFAERVLAPMCVSADSEGAHWDAGMVTAPAGFKEAYRQYVDAGWPRLGHAEVYGGTALPYSLKLVVTEFLQTANQAWCNYAALNDGAIKTLLSFAKQELIDAFVPKLVSGEWTGTMCLTEPQCGSDLNLVRTRAESSPDGNYRICGTKIFISSGEQDLADNIVHLVLARLPNAPAGTRGISLFVVPKFRLNADGSPGTPNRVWCDSIEDKMGLKGSATCSMVFDRAEGALVGEPNRGLNCMFVYINRSRLGVSQQAQGHVEGAYQASLAYARERLQGRAPGTATAPDQPAHPLISHPDIRRMLLVQKAIAEGGRALVHLCGKWLDLCDCADLPRRMQAESMLALLTPIAKGFLSELASEATDLGIQILGGHGYTKGWGIEQRVRDVRVTRIYEGTTGIQGMDLLSRKMLGGQRASLQTFSQEILDFCDRNATEPCVANLLPRLRAATHNWREITDEIAQRSHGDAQLVGAVAVDYLMLAGYVTLGYVWATTASTAGAKLATGAADPIFYSAKLQTSRFYFDKLLPRALAHAESIRTGSASLNADFTGDAADPSGAYQSRS